VLEIYVDADACPVKEEVLRVAARHGLHVHVVSNQWLRLPGDAKVEMVVVGDGLDAADDWIAGRIGASDVAVTADIGLAARCLAAGAQAIRPTGKPFDESSIGMAQAMRDLTADLRDRGEISGGAPAFSKQDRSRFLQALEAAVQAARRSVREASA
jgi:hypothetical protein